MKSRRLLAHELAEAHHDAELIGIDAEKERVPGDDYTTHDRGQEHERPGYAAAVHDLLHAVLAAFQHFLEIRGL